MGIPDMCRDHRCLTACQKQYRQNVPAGQIDFPTWVEVHVMGILATCIDHRHLTTCQKQHRQNEPAGQVDISTRVEVRVTGDPKHVYGPKTSHRLSKTTQRE